MNIMGTQMKVMMGIVSVVIASVGYILYIIATLRSERNGKTGTAPHPLSWGLFGFLTATGWLVQVRQGGMAGSWCLGVTAAFCFVIAAVSWIHHRWVFAWDEWVLVGSGVVLFGFCLATKTPFWSALLATSADFAGYYPTLKKGWLMPWRDSPRNFMFNSVKCIPALMALSLYSWSNCIYLVMLLVMNGFVAFMLVSRRKHLGGAP